MNKQTKISWLSAALATVALVMVVSYSPLAYRPSSEFHGTTATYISGTGTAGAVNTAQTVITRSLPANTLTQVGDRLRIRIFLSSAVASAIAATVKVNGISVASLSVTTNAVPDIMDVYIDYIDDTHANVQDQELTGIGSLSGFNVSGFSFSGSQNITVEQSAINSNFITIYEVCADVFPKLTV